MALPPLVAGGLVAGSLPPVGVWPAAPIGVAVLAGLLRDARWRRRVGIGLLAGVGQFAPGCWWAVQFTALGYLVLVVVEAGFVAVACGCCPPGRGRVPALIGLLTLAEWARDAWPFGGLPLAGMALGQVGGPLLALARLGGPLLVGGGVAVSGVAIALVLERRVGPWRVALGLLVLVGALTAWATGAPDGGPGTRTLSVAAIQGGGQRGVSAIDVPAANVLGAQLAATAGVNRRVDLAVWPEDSVSLGTSLTRSPLRAVLAATARMLRATFVVGITAPAGPKHFYNEAVVFAPSGRYVATFEKVHPVPFGEYVPFRSLLAHFVSLAAVPRDAVPGHGSGLVGTPVGPLALLISYEVFFPERGRSGVRAGGELLVVPTNTASYASSQVPTQELAAARLQAVAEGRDLVQAASTGVSAVVDADGRVLGRTGLGSPAVLYGRVRLRTGATLYERFGELPVLLTALVAVAAGWAVAAAPIRRRRRPSRSRRPRWAW
jgi:apolipoprotein N-acyltransferase